jgi:NAD-dependent deacetylase
MKKILVFTGAGVSAESGIPTFRASDGLWCNHNIFEVATPEGWEIDQQKVLNFYNERRSDILKSEPNEAHKIIADLERNFNVTVVTQNIDDLHERAGSTKVVHLHGEILKVRSTGNPNLVYERRVDLEEGDLCEDGHQLRPHVVWFGEIPENLDYAAWSASEADICIIVGTSMQVYPAAGIPLLTRIGTPIYYVDPSEINSQVLDFEGRNFHHIKEKASVGMKKVCPELK